MFDENDEWRMAPAYDLTFSHGPGGEHSMTVYGEGKEPRREDMIRLADEAGILKLRADEIIEEVCAATSRWTDFSEEAGLAGPTTKQIQKLIV
jgi:serine/threonine-protein kinase HipA